MSAVENKRLMQAIFARVAVGDGALFEITEYSDSVLCERVLGPFSASG